MPVPVGSQAYRIPELDIEPLFQLAFRVSAAAIGHGRDRGPHSIRRLSKTIPARRHVRLGMPAVRAGFVTRSVVSRGPRSHTRRDSWRSLGYDAQEAELNRININCRVHGGGRPRAFSRARARSRSLNIQARAHRLKSCLWIRRCVAPGFCRGSSPGAGWGASRARDDRWSRRGHRV